MKRQNMDMSIRIKSSKWGRNPPEKQRPLLDMFSSHKIIEFHFLEEQKIRLRAKPFRKKCTFSARQQNQFLKIKSSDWGRNSQEKIYLSLTRDTFRYLSRVLIQFLKSPLLAAALQGSPSCRHEGSPSLRRQNPDARNQTFGKIPHVSYSKLVFWGNFMFFRYPFSARNSSVH